MNQDVIYTLKLLSEPQEELIFNFIATLLTDNRVRPTSRYKKNINKYVHNKRNIEERED